MGHYDDSITFINKNSNLLKDSRFAIWFEEFAKTKSLSKKNRDDLTSEWNSQVRDYVIDRNTTPKGDVFKYSLYKLMGRWYLSTYIAN